MAMDVTDPAPWLIAVRGSHDRLATLVGALDASDLDRQSYCRDWTIAQVLSHLGSQAEIFSLFVDAGLAGRDAPGQDAFPPVWDAWNVRTPGRQASDSVAANEALVARLESLDAGTLAAFRLDLFGMDLDVAGLLRMRLSEHAVHTWDIAVTLDANARVPADAVALLVDGLGDMAARVGRPAAHPATISVTTSDPERRFMLDEGGVSLEPVEGTSTPTTGEGSLDLSSEALLRLVYGRLNESDTVQAEGVDLESVKAVFAGF